MLSFEIYANREALYETHFHSPAMKEFLEKTPLTMTTGFDITHYEEVAGSFLDKPGDRRECAIMYDSRIKCKPGKRDVVLDKFSALARTIESDLEDIWTFMVLKSLDNDTELRIFQRYASWKGLDEQESFEPRLSTLIEIKEEITSMEGRAFVPCGDGWLHR